MSTSMEVPTKYFIKGEIPPREKRRKRDKYDAAASETKLPVTDVIKMYSRLPHSSFYSCEKTTHQSSAVYFIFFLEPDCFRSRTQARIQHEAALSMCPTVLSEWEEEEGIPSVFFSYWADNVVEKSDSSHCEVPTHHHEGFCRNSWTPISDSFFFFSDHTLQCMYRAQSVWENLMF